MPADIALPISVNTNTPDVDRRADRNSVVDQSVGDQRKAFDQEYQRQQNARQADIRADERASQRADRQADDARRTEQNRQDERISQAERRSQQQESGKRLPENGNDRARQVERESGRAQDLASQERSRHEQAGADKSRVDNSRREAQQAGIRQTQRAESNPLDAQQQTQKAQQLQHQNAQHTKIKNQPLESDMVDEAPVESTDKVLSPYILQQLSDTGVTPTGEVAGNSGPGAETSNSMSSLAKWMEQTLVPDQAAADNNASETVEVAVEGVPIVASADKEAISTSESTISNVLASEASKPSSEGVPGVSSGKASDPAIPSDVIVKSDGIVDGTTDGKGDGKTDVRTDVRTDVKSGEAKVAEFNAAKHESAEALRNMQAEKTLDTVIPGSKVLPLSQAIESVNRSDRLAEPTFLKQAALSSEVPSNGLSLDELKQMMQERKALLEGGRQEGGVATLKAGAEDVMTSQADKLLALDKRLNQGMEGLRQLRIPGQEAKKTSVDDSVKPSSFGRALEQMSSIKTEEVKPLSTSIATPMNKPGFVPEFNQRIMMMIGQKIQSAEIKLNPEELGSIDVSIKFNQDQQASIVFASPHTVTRDALEQGAQRLRDMLEQNGVDVDNVDIQENLTHDRHNQGNDDERGLAANSKGQDGVSDNAEGMEGSVATIETDSLVDFYA